MISLEMVYSISPLQLVCMYWSETLNRKQWNKVFLLPHKYILTNKIKEFLYKLIHGYYPVKANICRFVADINNQCTFCDCKGETVEHIFVDCFHTTSFWFHLERYLSSMLGKETVLQKTDILFYFQNSNFSIDEIYIINLICILAKFFIHKMIWLKKLPSFYVFKTTDFQIYLDTLVKLNQMNKKLVKTLKLLKKYKCN